MYTFWSRKQNHTPKEEETKWGDPIVAHWTAAAPPGFNFDGINGHNPQGAVVGAPPLPPAPAAVDWWADWSSAAPLPAGGGDFDLIYCGGTGAFRPKGTVLTKNGAGAAPGHAPGVDDGGCPERGGIQDWKVNWAAQDYLCVLAENYETQIRPALTCILGSRRASENRGG
jgi:hypothetical protein